MTEEQKSKDAFVSMLGAALVSCGDGRYDFLDETPLEYVVDGAEEFVCCGGRRACVTGDSLTALMGDLADSGIF